MMKKNGFTLAEVLITLAIIGVVATMTLPALMTNTQEQQAKTAVKKAINTLTEAVQTNLALEGYDYSQLKQGYGDITDFNETEMSLARILGERAAVDFSKSKATSDISTVFFGEGAGAQVVYLRDGSALLIPGGEGAALDDEYNKMQSDDLPKGFTIVLDINGAKAPNVLSNCEGNTSGVKDDDLLNTVDQTDGEAGAKAASATRVTPTKCSKANRVIKDQFTIKLRGNVAQPDGAAATWAYEN